MPTTSSSNWILSKNIQIMGINLLFLHLYLKMSFDGKFFVVLDSEKPRTRLHASYFIQGLGME